MDRAPLRREQLRRLLASEQLDAFIISHPVNVTYLTGFTGDTSVLFLSRVRDVLVSDFRYIEQLAEECPGLETYIRPAIQKLPGAVAQVVNQLGCRNVGFESSAVTVAELEALKNQAPSVIWKGASDRVEQLRAVKDDDEIAQIRAAIRIGENAYTAFRCLVRPTDSEKQLTDVMEDLVRRAGGQATCFPTIVAVGERAALPHAPPTERTVASGELLLVDWGVTGRLYKSDLTRVLATRKISTKLEQVYMVVLNAQRRAIQAIRPGVQAQSIDAEARGVIAAAGFGDFFGHGLGHGLGLQVHEGPAIRPGSDTVLQPGMLFTVEPGIYLPGWGGVRIEDDVLVTPDGCEVLSRLSRQLEALAP
jgi:Xaa-Pro aminopeptidase